MTQTMTQTTTATTATTAHAHALSNPALWGGKGSFPASQEEFEEAWEAIHGLPATPANRRALVEHLRQSPASYSTLAVAPGLDHDVAVFRPEGRDRSDGEEHPTRRVRIYAPWTSPGPAGVFRVVMDTVP